MKIILHIGFECTGASRLQSVLAAKRDQMTTKGVRYANSPGKKNHTRLHMAVTDPAHVDPLRFDRGYASPERQSELRQDVQNALVKEVDTHQPDTLILSASQLASSLVNQSELTRLRDMLLTLTEDVQLLAHVDEPARMLARHYAKQVQEGRGQSLDLELANASAENWWQASLKHVPQIDPLAGQFLETQAPPFWLDFNALTAHWEGVFGPDTLHLRGYDEALFASENVTSEIRDAFGLKTQIGKAQPEPTERSPSDASLARSRQFNALLLKLLANHARFLPRPLWREILSGFAVEGPPLDAAQLAPISQRFASDFKNLAQKHGLKEPVTQPLPADKDWVEADPTFGFRASQYLLAYMWRIDRADRVIRRAQGEKVKSDPVPLSPDAERIMPPTAVRNYKELQTSRFAPHNRIGSVNEEESAEAYTEFTRAKLPEGSSGNVIVGCMKNEAPYIIEWVAYHRAIGFDNFLIYTNGCEDGTDEILDRLQELGVMQHRLNDDWKGNSPQQFALNRALKEPVIEQADWIAHIDVDEFVNIRTGNGTLNDLFDAMPDATNLAMTWRLFGHNDVTQLHDEFVIDQFDTCAPKYCPKPHTVWGFKTMFRNVGAYAKMSCHRPNKLEPAWRNKVKWVNGSGKDITDETAEKGWRSSMKSVGYDLVQLNHYALRSAESFLIKRQRGRALHVDRSIGINYWIRMDWSVHQDVTIKRNLPRLKAEYDRLLSDPVLKEWHEKGVAWHRAKADELHDTPEFSELYDQALQIKLTETERVAYALALDMET
ncbi:MAG: glycosyltransferase family 2 protein [Paracoccaceae bacterium]